MWPEFIALKSFINVRYLALKLNKLCLISFGTHTVWPSLPVFKSTSFGFSKSVLACNEYCVFLVAFQVITRGFPKVSGEKLFFWRQSHSSTLLEILLWGRDWCLANPIIPRKICINDGRLGRSVFHRYEASSPIKFFWISYMDFWGFLSKYQRDINFRLGTMFCGKLSVNLEMSCS